MIIFEIGSEFEVPNALLEIIFLLFWGQIIHSKLQIQNS